MERHWDDAASETHSDNSAARVSDVDRRSFLRAHSRKSIESNPEDEEFFVGDDGMIAVVAIDDRKRIERLKQLLERKERETRQAAEYGLSLLESNEELELQVATLKIQLETETTELAVERDAFCRRHEHALLDIENWKRKLARVEEEKHELGAKLQQVVRECERHNGGVPSTSSNQQQQERIDELELTVAELQANNLSKSAALAVLKKWKAVVEAAQRERADVDAMEMSSEQLYIHKVETDQTQLRQLLEQTKAEETRLARTVSEYDGIMKQMRKDIEELHDELSLKRRENTEQMELLLTAESKCSRLQRELALMEHISYMSVAVIDHDDDDDDDEEDAENNAQEKPEVPEKSKTEDIFEQALQDERRSSRQSRGASVSAAFSSYHAPGGAARVPPTPSSMATHQKLHHYFHLTAQSIIHENDLHELCFDSSSRFTIDAWYREIIDEDVPFLEWHSWLIKRISAVAASVKNENSPSKDKRRGSGGLSSPFLSFARRKESGTRAQPSNAVPSPAPATPRVPFSVAHSFFRLLGRRENQSELDSA